MTEIIHSYTSGGVTYKTVRDSDGKVLRNRSEVRLNDKGRKYIMTASRYNRKRKYLCADVLCYKNAKVGLFCRDHTTGLPPPQKSNKPGPEDPWAKFRAAHPY